MMTVRTVDSSVRPDSKASTATPAIDLITSDKDVIILRTFSKLYGMAGLRAGAALGRPDLLEKLKGYGGLGIMPSTGMAGATAALKEKGLVAERKKAMADVRDDLFAWMGKKGYAFVPSEANMVMVDTKPVAVLYAVRSAATAPPCSPA